MFLMHLLFIFHKKSIPYEPIKNWFLLTVRIELWMHAGSLESTKEA